MTTKRYILPLFLYILFSLSSALSYAKVNQKLINQKCDYVVSVAKVLKSGTAVSNSFFKIGVVGKGTEIKNFIKELETRFKNLKLRGKPVKIESYFRIKKDVKVDLLIISSKTKITANDLKGVLKTINYILLTDSSPYGISTLNNNTINQLEQEIQSTNINLSKAENTIENQLEKLEKNDSIIEKNVSIIETKNQVIDKSKTIINLKDNEIVAQDSTIKSQKNQLIIAIVFILLIVSLLLVILKINKERKMVLAEVETKNKNILDSLSYAKNIQLAMLPNTTEFTKQFKDYFILYKPKDIVSGDFYWLEELGDKIYLSVADCTGHGVPGAMMSMICNKALTKVVKEIKITEPAKILDQTVVELQDYFSKSEKTIHDGMDLSLICIDKNKQQLTFSGAHNPLFYFTNGELKILKADRQPIGYFSFRKPFTQQTINLSQVDSLYLLSDGYTDQFGGPKNKKYSRRQFKKFLTNIQSEPFNTHFSIIKKEITQWQGNKNQTDDISMIGIKF